MENDAVSLNIFDSLISSVFPISINDIEDIVYQLRDFINVINVDINFDDYYDKYSINNINTQNLTAYIMGYLIRDYLINIKNIGEDLTKFFIDPKSNFNDREIIINKHIVEKYYNEIKKIIEILEWKIVN